MNEQNFTTIGVKKKRWVVCFDNGILDMDLSVYEKMVYIVLCSHAKKDGSCFPSVHTIAREASCSRAKVFGALKRLEEKGVISRNSQIFKERGQTSNLYEILDIEQTNSPSKPETGYPGDKKGESVTQTGGVHHMDGGGLPRRRGESTTWTGGSTTQTGGVHHIDPLYKVLELNHINNTKELKTPPTPPGGGEGNPEPEAANSGSSVSEPVTPSEGLRAINPVVPESAEFSNLAEVAPAVLPQAQDVYRDRMSQGFSLRRDGEVNPEPEAAESGDPVVPEPVEPSETARPILPQAQGLYRDSTVQISLPQENGGRKPDPEAAESCSAEPCQNGNDGALVKRPSCMGQTFDLPVKSVKQAFLFDDPDLGRREAKKTVRDKPSPVPQCPHESIIALYHEILPELPKVREWGKTCRKYLDARWTENPERQNLDWWCEYFTSIRSMNWLMGLVPREDQSPFRADMEWLVRPANMTKILNGRYSSSPAVSKPRTYQEAKALEARKKGKTLSYSAYANVHDNERENVFCAEFRVIGDGQS